MAHWCWDEPDARRPASKAVPTLRLSSHKAYLGSASADGEQFMYV